MWVGAACAMVVAMAAGFLRLAFRQSHAGAQHRAIGGGEQVMSAPTDEGPASMINGPWWRCMRRRSATVVATTDPPPIAPR